MIFGMSCSISCTDVAGAACAVECRAGDILRDEVIGKGASAEVYKVVMANGQTVAVKRCAC